MKTALKSLLIAARTSHLALVKNNKKEAKEAIDTAKNSSLMMQCTKKTLNNIHKDLYDNCDKNETLKRNSFYS
jgi:hypothetical protein